MRSRREGGREAVWNVDTETCDAFIPILPEDFVSFFLSQQLLG